VKLLTLTNPSHPILTITQEQYLAYLEAHGEEATNELVRQINAAVALELDDPHRGCYVPPVWENVMKAFLDNSMITIFGGNRSMKSTFAAWYVNQLLAKGTPWKRGVNKPLHIACFHSSEKSSIVQQQALIHRFLPKELKKVKRTGDGVTKINYSVSAGFTDAIIVLPQGHIVQFFNYKQDISVIEGYEFDFAWFDELVPPDWLEAVDFRLATRSGRNLITFTPVYGYTPTVANIMAGADIVRTAPLDPRVWKDKAPNGNLIAGCPKGCVPVEMQPSRKGARIFFFLSEWNPYSPFDEIVNKVSDQPLETRIIRTTGYTKKRAGNLLANFSSRHIITPEEFRIIESRGGRRVCVTDPAGAKNWFIKWYFITPSNHYILYREFPDADTYGEWAVPDGKGHFKAGDAQFAGVGRGVSDYKHLILTLEGAVRRPDGSWDMTNAERISERFIDPRFGGSPVASAEEPTSLCKILADTSYRDGVCVAPSMPFEPAPLHQAQDGYTPVMVGVNLLNELMSWDYEREMDLTNTPRWRIVSTCKQSAFAYKEYAGDNGPTDPLKDIIDPDRYFIATNPIYYDNQTSQIYAPKTAIY